MLRFCSAFFLLLAIAAAEQADSIWSARYVITMDARRRIIENGAIAVRGQRIVGVGTRLEIDKQFTAKQHLDRPAAILAPGLINTHTHAAMSLLRGIADDMTLQDWLTKFIFPAEAKNVTADSVRWGTRLACLEMLLSGTTTYTDMYYFEDVVAEASKEAGMRGVLGETIIGFPAPDHKTPEETLQATEKFLQRFHNDPLIVPAVAPHSIYTVPENILRASRALADKYKAPVLIHLSETKKENDDSLAKRHMSPARYLDSIGFFAGPTLGAHGVWLDDADRKILNARRVGLSHCPSSNTKLASGIAHVDQILREGIAMGLGTDGVAGSGNNTDMIREMDIAAKMQKIAQMDPRALNAQTAFEMATITGARALGMEREIGSLEVGKRADLITLRLDSPHATPLYEIYSQIVYALNGSDVRDVMINGKQIVRDRQVLTLNAAEILAKAAEYRTKISNSLQ